MALLRSNPTASRNMALPVVTPLPHRWDMI
jgi:hypothetical protein